MSDLIYDRRTAPAIPMSVNIPHDKGTWTDLTLTALRLLWAPGYGTKAIGAYLGFTKNAVVGKAHRLDLPSRPSPIIRDGRTPKTNHEIYLTGKAKRATIPLLASQASAAPPVAVHAVALPESIAVPNPAATAAHDRRVAVPEIIRKQRPMLVDFRSSVPARPSKIRKLEGRIMSCQWPIGEPGNKGFRFCGDPSQPGRPYCEDHCKVAYVVVREKREDAA